MSARGRRQTEPRLINPLFLAVMTGALLLFTVWAARTAVGGGSAAWLGAVGMLACGIQWGIRSERRRVADQRAARGKAHR